MADLGEYYSILGTAQQTRFRQQRREREKERDEARRDRYLGYIAKPILGTIGEGIAEAFTSPWERKFDDFKKTKLFTEEKALDVVQRRNATSMVALEKKARDTVGGRDAYWKQIGIDRKKQRMIALDPERKEEYESDAMLPYIEEQGIIIGKELRMAHEKGLPHADAFLASGTFSDSLVNKRSSGWFSAGIDVVQGDSIENQDRRAEEAYKNSTYYSNRERYMSYEEARLAGKSMSKAHKDAATHVPDKGTYYDPFTISQAQIEIGDDGTKTIVVVDSVYQRGTKAWKNGKLPISISKGTEIEYSEEGLAKYESGLVAKANQQFNYVTKSKTYFSDKAFAAFKAEVEEAEIDLTNIKTIKERTEVGRIFNTYDIETNMKSFKQAKTRAEEKEVESKIRLMDGDIPLQNAADDYQLMLDGKEVFMGNVLQTDEQVQDRYFHHLRRIDTEYNNILKRVKTPVPPHAGTPPSSAPTSPPTTGGSETYTDSEGKTHNRHSSLSDIEWEAYKKDLEDSIASAGT